MNGMQGQIPPQALMAAMMARLGQQGGGPGGPPGMPPGMPPSGPMGGPPGMPPGGMPPMGPPPPPPQMQPGAPPPMTPPMPGQGNRVVASLMDLGNHMKFVLSQLDDGDEAKDRITSMAQELDNVIAMKTQPASMGRPMPDQMPDQPVDEMGNLGGSMNSQGNPPPEGAPGPGR